MLIQLHIFEVFYYCVSYSDESASERKRIKNKKRQTTRITERLQGSEGVGNHGNNIVFHICIHQNLPSWANIGNIKSTQSHALNWKSIIQLISSAVIWFNLCEYKGCTQPRIVSQLRFGCSIRLFDYSVDIKLVSWS